MFWLWEIIVSIIGFIGKPGVQFAGKLALESFAAMQWKGSHDMQMVTRTEAQRPFGTAPSSPTALPDANRIIGEFRVRFLDREDGVTFTSHQTFVTGGRVGARDGYETLKDAMSELAIATSGATSAAAVIERGGRYYGHLLKGRDHEEGSRAPLRAVNLEPEERAEVVELRLGDTPRATALRALVDGTWSHRFRG